MQTLIDPFELRAIGPDTRAEVPGRIRPRMASIVIEVEWDEPPPACARSRGPRVWTSEE